MRRQTSFLAHDVEGPLLTGCIAIADGTVFRGTGFGATGESVGELCFNTAMTGYQEVMTDPSYAGQIVTFTFPHIGNTGINPEDNESTMPPVALGIVTRNPPSLPSNWRATQTLHNWMKDSGRIGISGIDTRRLTRHIRDSGMPHAVIAHHPRGLFNLDEMIQRARVWPGLSGTDLATKAGCQASHKQISSPQQADDNPSSHVQSTPYRVVAIDYGIKHNILSCLASVNCATIVVPPHSSYEQIMSHKPEGIFLSNGPGDPAATGVHTVPLLKKLIEETRLPIFGICLGHQMIALALGAKTRKMLHGHHGINHPVKDLETGKVEITSMNHGFTVDAKTLPCEVLETHVSLFDGTNCGLRTTDHRIFSVQYHPEASPGPQDSWYMFTRFSEQIQRARRSLS